MTSKDKDIKKKTTKKKTTKRTAKVTDENAISNQELAKWISGLLCALLALMLLLSFTSYLFTGKLDQGKLPGDTYNNWLGSIGHTFAESIMQRNFGLATFVLPILMFATSMRILSIGHVRLWKWFVNCALITVWSSTALAYIQLKWGWFENSFLSFGGGHGKTLVDILNGYVGPVGIFMILAITLGIYLLYLSGEAISTLSKTLELARRKATRSEGEEEESEEEDTPEEQLGTEAFLDDENFTSFDEDIKEEADEEAETVSHSEREHRNTATTIDFTSTLDNVQKQDEAAAKVDDTPFEIEVSGQQVESKSSDPNAPKITIGEAEEEAELDETGALEPYDPKLDLSQYRYPTLDLLQHYDIKANAMDMEEQTKNKNDIINVLRSFGVEISSIKATVGPTITLYEITPAPGVRITKIRNLEDDIALSLRALGIRIIAPIPGKGTIGIEVPNAKPQMVSMESIINSRKFQETEFELPMALGKTITNEIYMVDLAKMPHLLVAGATGQGKSVGLNAIITSLLYKKHPAELKIVMVDPKKVEFSVYNPIVNHFLAQVEGNEDTDEPIITDVSKVVQTLKSLCQEMDTRYDLLKMASARNVKEYNEKFKSRKLNPDKGHKFMPYIVVIIDEFGDLIMTAGKEVELPIARIAQLARAVGIHMIIATQRPTTNIITGTIKANFPARMAFKVSSQIDSRTILDRTGANQLVGKGDMLFLTGNDPVRVQCAFVDTPEVERIAKFIACQQSYLHPFPLPLVEMEGEEGGAADVDVNHLDPMFEEVARLVVSSQQGSTSMIQRKFSIGYNRAGRLMDQLEKVGIVGPAHGSKPREVLCISEDELQYKLNNLG